MLDTEEMFLFAPKKALLYLLTLVVFVGSHAQTQAASLEPVPDTAALMPAHGTVSIAPAAKWQDSLATGNGRMGALLAGEPQHETLIVNHCKMWLPLGSREVLPDVGRYLPEMRRIIAEKGYGEYQRFFEAKAREQGWGGKIIWTDPFHPAFFLKIDQPTDDPISDYARIEDFSTGEVWAQWKTTEGQFARRCFVSRTDNVLVLKLTAPKGKLSCSVQVPRVGNDKINSTVIHTKDLITLHNVYVHGKGGYDCAIRVAISGGTVECNGQTIRLVNADAATLVMRVEPYKQGESEPLASMVKSLARLRMNYEALLTPHAKAHGKIFNRVTVDLGGTRAERAMATEPLLDLAKKENRLPAALLERMYDAGRYEFICAAGPDTPPNLFGIWTGTWTPAWSGDYTLDTNIQLDIESAFSANMAECMAGYFKLMEEFVPAFQANAKMLYGCRGILSGTRASNTGLHLHWGGWPGQAWTPGASWLAHWFYDYYQYTGDRRFLRDRAVPYMKQCALFWEDFLQGTEDANGKFHFSPSYSAENGLADNSTQDISITRELLTNLIAACEKIKIEQDGVARWKAILEKLPPYLINEEGQLKEWAIPNKGENNNHRHLMHLYGAFESQEFSEEADPKLFQAARVALNNRLRESKETATHGRMHMGLTAASLGMGDEAYGRLVLMATDRSMYPSMITAHNDGPTTWCDDGNGSIPEMVNRMVVQSKPGRLMLLPAIPTALPQGTICGTRARGQIGIDRISWDMKAGTLTAVLTSQIKQIIDVVLARGMVVDQLTANGKILPVIEQGVQKQGCRLTLPSGNVVTLDVKFNLDRVTIDPHSKPIKALIVDGFSNHDWRQTTRVIRRILEDTQLFNIEVSTTPSSHEDPGWDTWRPRFEQYDVVIQNTNNIGNSQLRWPRAVEEALADYVRSGGGLYVLHSANNAFSHWQEYDRMIGLGWRGPDAGTALQIAEDGEIVRIPPGTGNGTSHGPRRDTVVRILNRHPINSSFPARWKTPSLEVYVYARGPAEDLTVLSYAFDETTQKYWPIEWVVQYGKGRVYNSTFGHLWAGETEPVSIRCIGFQTTLIRATEWLATGTAKWPVPSDFPAEDAVSLKE